ncbi:MAG: hypothetical protein EXR65_02855 [Dehalococcoidia bacterium]|nr:hypothetical protein [Dehalococcoidia bacterium]
MTSDRGRDPDRDPLPDDGDGGDDSAPSVAPAQVIAEIERGDTLPSEHLRALAGPSDAVVREFVSLWPRLAPERRREVLARLHRLAQDDATLDFHRIHLSALRDPDPATRMLAVEGLWEQERTEYMDLLLDQLRRDSEATVRAAIALALAPWVVSAEFGLLSEEDAEQLAATLREAVEDMHEEEEVRACALEALGASSDESVTDLIAELYETGGQRMRIAALRAMGRNGDDRWLPVLTHCFTDDDVDVRAAAATSAGQLLMGAAIDPLTELIEDTDEEVQLAAIGALGEIGGLDAERVLTALLGHRERHLAGAAQEALNGLRALALTFDSGGGGEDDER